VTLILTIVSLSPAALDTVIDLAANSGHADAPPSWLSRFKACDIALDASEGDLEQARALISEQFEGLPIDWCLQPGKGRRKRVLICDMDSTVIGQECLDELADLKGIKPEIAAITERAMRGELDFEAALRERIALMRGLTRNDIEHVLETRITLNPGIKTVSATMAANGAYTMLVSGGFVEFTGPVAERAGFQAHRGNAFMWDGDTIQGVANPILGREAKRRALMDACDRMKVLPHDGMAVGDGANDLAMIEAAGLGVAYRAKPVVAAQAAAKIDHTDLTTLLYFQGYRESEFIHRG
jgi:phosphoserine phosphatase